MPTCNQMHRISADSNGTVINRRRSTPQIGHQITPVLRASNQSMSADLLMIEHKEHLISQ
jgi:hypothetical protein